MYADQESRSRQQAGSRARIHALIRSPLLCGRISRAVRRARPPSSPTPHSFPALTLCQPLLALFPASLPVFLKPPSHVPPSPLWSPEHPSHPLSPPSSLAPLSSSCILPISTSCPAPTCPPFLLPCPLGLEATSIIKHYTHQPSV